MPFSLNALRSVLTTFRISLQKRRLRALRRSPLKRVVIGAGGTRFKGWVPTERDVLDILEEGQWREFFAQDSLDALLAEHVWEHLTMQEAAAGARNCFQFLKPGGYLRIAVPDGLHPDPVYRERVAPGGSGAGSDDHKVLYRYDTLSAVFLAAGFQVKLLEYFDEQGEFHARDWNAHDGFIERSREFDPRNREGVLAYTSIILDAIKPPRSDG